jgi:HSP20 family protein
VSKDDISLDLNDGQLTISVTRQQESEREQGGYVHRERSFQTQNRSVYLPDADAQAIKAKLADGVLTVTVPKAAKVDKSRKIEIE